MKGTLIISALLSFFFCTLSIAQDMDVLPGELWRQNGKFYQGNQEVDRDVFWGLVNDQADAGVYFRRGDGQELGGTVLTVTGGILGLGGLLVYSTGSLTESEDGVDRSGKATLAIAGGLGALVTGIVLLRSGKKNLQRSIDTYNRVEVDQKRLGLSLNAHGFGLRFIIGR